MYRTFLQYLRRKSATEWPKEPLLLKCLGFDELQTEFHAGGMKRNCLIWGTIVLTASVCASFILHAADAKSHENADGEKTDITSAIIASRLSKRLSS